MARFFAGMFFGCALVVLFQEVYDALEYLQSRRGLTYDQFERLIDDAD